MTSEVDPTPAAGGSHAGGDGPGEGGRGGSDPALVVRPDPTGAGFQAAAAALRLLRDGAALEPASVARLRVTVDTSAARAAGHVVPLPMLARADAVRRGP
jgi:hypothetical protein